MSCNLRVRKFVFLTLLLTAIFLVGCGGGGGHVTATPALATQYTVAEIGGLGQYKNSSAGCITNNGYIVGTAWDYYSESPWTWARGQDQAVRVTNELGYRISSANESGQAVGMDTSFKPIVVSLISGAVQELEQQARIGVGVEAINDSGITVGFCDLQPVVWDRSGAKHNLQTPADTMEAEAIDINNSSCTLGILKLRSDGCERTVLWYPGGGIGQMISGGREYAHATATCIGDNGCFDVHYSAPKVGGSAYAKDVVFWPDGRQVTLSYCGRDYTRVECINAFGYAAGLVGDCPDCMPVLWNLDGSAVELPLPVGHVAGEARSINDNGVVVGYSKDSQRQLHAVIWTPVQQ